MFAVPRRCPIVVLGVTLILVSCGSANRPTGTDSEGLDVLWSDQEPHDGAQDQSEDGVFVASIGMEGGRIEIDDPTSPLRGVVLEIPEGALSSKATFKIKLADEEVSVPGGTALSPKYDVRVDGVSNIGIPITIWVPITHEPPSGQVATVLSRSDGHWHLPYMSWRDKVTGKAVAVVGQFSIFGVFSYERRTVSVDFQPDHDAFQDYKNNADYLDSSGKLQEGGTCYGLSWFVREYWRNFRSKCGRLGSQNASGKGWYREDQEAAIAIYLQRLYFDDGVLKDIVFYLAGLKNNFDAGTFMDSIVEALWLSGEPVLTVLYSPAKLAGHAVLVYGYDESEPSRLQIFDPNKGPVRASLTCSPSEASCRMDDNLFVIPFIVGRGSHMDAVAKKDSFARQLAEGTLDCVDICRDYYWYSGGNELSCLASPGASVPDGLGQTITCFDTDEDSCLEGVLSRCGDRTCSVTETIETCAEDCSCQRDCAGRVCGPDPVCGESCGTCTGGKTCNTNGQCVAEECEPDCTGRECGPDPICGESCGTCTGTDTCNSAGACVPAGCGTNCGEMVTVPAGPFWQGCNESVDTNCQSEEKLYHEVNVPAFEIDKYEVTVDLYGDCVTGGGCTASTGTSSYCNQGKSGKSDHPMNCITWYQAREYCAWAGKRLCSESEWEKASRWTDGRKYPWGNETATCDYAVMDDGGRGCGTDSTWAVGSKPAGASPYGALDMSGNVWEWVEDDWHSNYTGAPTNGSAWVDDPRASFRVVRGGCFGDGYDDGLRSSNRYNGIPAVGVANFGVRCCRSK